MKLPGPLSLALTLALVLVIVIGAAPALAAGEARVLDDGWFALYLGDAKSGWMRLRTEQRGDGDAKRFVTLTDTLISMKRDGAGVDIRVTEEIEEDAAGRVLRFSQTQDLGFTAQKTSGILRPDGSIEVTRGPGKPLCLPYPEGALGPAAVNRRLLETGLREGAKLTLVAFVTEFLGQRVEQETVVGKLETIDLLGRKASLRRVDARLSVLPACPMVSWLDDENLLQAMDMILPGAGTLRLIRTAREVALRPGEPAEMFTTTFVAPSRIIEHPRALKRAGYRLAASEGRLPDLPSGGGQTVVRNEDGSLRVVLDLTKPVPEGYDLPCREEAKAPHLRANRFLQSGDARVVALAREAVGETKNAVAAARAIERVARARITKKTMNVAFATAAEVAEHLEGDCSEHAVLCAAMARAVGLPSRVVMGLVYLSPVPGFGGKTGSFAYHMWAEVWVGDDTWLPIDAAMNGMDATHIAIRRTGLDEVNPLVELSLPLLNVIGNLEIGVLVAK